jgi:hypothetical protein
MIDDYGGTPLADFPVQETPKWAEWEVAAVVNGSGASYTELKAWAMNHTAWPARVAKDIEYRYFFDASEVFAAGLTEKDIKVEGKSQQYDEGEQGHATVSGPYKYEGDPTGNTYYALIKFDDGRAIMPTGQSEHRDEVQFRVSIPDAVDGKPTTGAWDQTNDWSYLGGLADATDLKKSDSINEHITMYVDGELVWGEEPDGTKPGDKTPDKPVVTTTTKPSDEKTTTTTTTTTPEATNSNEGVLYGDANVDNNVTVADAVAILQSIGNKDKYELKPQGKINGDVDGEAGITANDALTIMKKDSGLFDKFPVEK